MSRDADVDIVKRPCLILDKKPRKFFGNGFRSRLVSVGLSWPLKRKEEKKEENKS